MKRQGNPVYFTSAGIVGTIAALLVALVCIRLGLWQLDRREQRRARNAAIAERMHAPPAVVSGPAADTAGLLYRTVEVAGEYDHEHSFVRPGRTHAGMRGVHLYTPLRLEGGGAVLVNRGWLPSRDGITADLTPFSRPGRVQVRGLALPIGDAPPRRDTATGPEAGPASLAADTFPRVWYHLDADRLERQLGYPILDFYVQRLPEPDAPELPAPIDPPELDAGPHLSYAIQWFSFATIALVGWGAIVIRCGEPGRRRGAD
ncbi:MAG TPA: SURF1 family protein [Longimicrobiales bacterium]